MIEQISLWGLFLSAFISATIAPGGSEAVLAYMVNQAHFPFAQLILMASVGNTLGALTTWGLGVLTAKKYPLEHLLSAKKQQAIAVVKKWGNWILLFSWLPIVGDGFCFAGGWLRLPFILATFAIAIGKTLRYLLIAYWAM